MSTALQSEDLAFESLYRLHRPPVYAYALATLRHPADAEDVTQTTFLNAYCALQRGVAPRDDLQWLLAIARNACRDRFRDVKRHPREEPLAEWMRLAQPEEPDYSVTEICKEISELSPRYRQILLLREFEGRSYAEISTQLGVTEAAVQTLLTRARRALRDELELGMTCAHSRRVALRHLNGVALRDERRALQRHLRRCAECATFVGRTPRTPVTRMLWLIWLPYRRVMTIVAGASATPGPTATVGVLAKLATITVVGGAAVTVGVKEVGYEPTAQHSRPIPVHMQIAPQKSHAVPRISRGRSTSAWVTPQVAAGRAPLTHASHRGAPASAPPAATSARGPSAGEPSAAASDLPGVPSSTPAWIDEPTVAQPAQSPQDAAAAPAPVQGDVAQSADAAVPVIETPNASVADSTSASPSTPPSAQSSTDPAFDPTPVTGPPATTPTPGQALGHDNVNVNGNGNAVGQGGTPPSQSNKPDAPPAHGRT